MDRLYSHYVYSAILGKVIGVYLGRPMEGWRKPRILKTFGPVDHYVAPQAGLPIVVPDDDISGTLTFVRALEDSGRLAETPEDFFGDTWLNYLLENQTILWWGGMGMSTEHTAYLRLKQGYRSPVSGSMELNGRKVSEQIGAQIFIDAFGLVAPGNPALAARLARRAARVSHDGEAVHAAVVVAVMIAAAYEIHDMDRLLDLAVSFIPADSLIARVHRDVRQWVREDRDWNLTQKRIEERYGYDRYGGNCHVIPNHALMVMAWAYCPDNFRDALCMVTTAGYDTDCNAGNVGAVMGAMLGLDAITQDHDFRTPMADRIILPTADGTNFATDCWNEARRIISLGNHIMGKTEPDQPVIWMDFAAPGACHGFDIDNDRRQDSRLSNPQGKGLEIQSTDLHLQPLRVSTPVYDHAENQTYDSVGTSKLYTGMTVSARLTASPQLRTVPYLVVATENGSQTVYGPTLNGSGLAVIQVPDTNAYPVLSYGLEFSSPEPGPMRATLDSVQAGGSFAYEAELLPGVGKCVPGWVTHVDRILRAFSDDPDPVRRLVSNEDVAYLYNGNRWWHEVTLKAQLNIHLADQAGLMVNFQGTQRYVSVTRRQHRLVLALQNYGETILDEVALKWPYDLTRTLAIQSFGNSVIAYLDGAPILQADRLPLACGAAGFILRQGNLGVGRVSITGTATPVL